ncbi:hypothetical protein [Alteromonas sp. CYL-A6]|uniref:hypothetical protein n=1 Tax=Alteromonas nitratireducens TaxID=3390813 RepID=UPI0034C09316
MDVTNKHLKVLLERTDNAFRALMRDPESSELNVAYESAKSDLDKYVASLKHTLNQRHQQRG